MRHISTTPFGGRPVTAGLLARQSLAEAPIAQQSVDKWALLRDVTDARSVLGVSDRDLAVLSALLSFYPDKELSDDDRLMVFPSNASLSERAHGMPESTLRRHLAALIHAGLILRHDSPNGKRYAIRDGHGRIDRAFGFDLRPLLVRAGHIAVAADTVRQDALRLRRQREDIVLRLRDATKLYLWSVEVTGREDMGLVSRLADMRRALRRKLDEAALAELAAAMNTLDCKIAAGLPVVAEQLSGNDVQNERHYQNSKSDNFESEPCNEKQEGQGETDLRLPLGLVLKATPEICDYAKAPVRDWRDLFNVAAFVHPMLGISPDAWDAARRAMGDDAAAVTVACMLQRIDHIRSPGGYLRTLTEKTANGAFFVGPMVMALLRAENTIAA